MTAYTGKIVDAHHHFWQPALGKQPWLLPDAHIPFRYGDYESIKREYLPPDLLADAAGFDVVGTVTMETEWNADDPVGEIEHIEGVAREYGLPNAAVAHAVLADPGVESVIAAIAEHGIVRGVRNKPGQAASAAAASTHPSLLSDPQWIAGFETLATYDLDFELQVAWWHLDEALALAESHPGQTIILNHAGLPSDRSREGLDGWAAAMRRFARAPNVAVKISGIGQPDRPWTVADNREIVETVADTFSVDRIMFASNFPVDGLTGSYADIYGGFVEITRDWSDDEQTAAFFGNAVKYYRLTGLAT
ncbi:putative TIM-barrel fold metal-dependent hydrolase [Conyzicola lurida]|uniref:Putative TIM-barrel fold metal-dependent hydrolase n=1 Tax=Conyzicola lurida TaxID=1172621 RepID=A0A841AKB8_9MICO|nr:amidohydrolase family protein [Conyzicola lurida]MBB5842113.1 putative TIM-barrel fold metal-dependent hydrolase [Conyzicola lurida]